MYNALHTLFPFDDYTTVHTPFHLDLTIWPLPLKMQNLDLVEFTNKSYVNQTIQLIEKSQNELKSYLPRMVFDSQNSKSNEIVLANLRFFWMQQYSLDEQYMDMQVHKLMGEIVSHRDPPVIPKEVTQSVSRRLREKIEEAKQKFATDPQAMDEYKRGLTNPYTPTRYVWGVSFENRYRGVTDQLECIYSEFDAYLRKLDPNRPESMLESYFDHLHDSGYDDLLLDAVWNYGKDYGFYVYKNEFLVNNKVLKNREIYDMVINHVNGGFVSMIDTDILNLYDKSKFAIFLHDYFQELYDDLGYIPISKKHVLITIKEENPMLFREMFMSDIDNPIWMDDDVWEFLVMYEVNLIELSLLIFIKLGHIPATIHGVPLAKVVMGDETCTHVVERLRTEMERKKISISPIMNEADQNMVRQWNEECQKVAQLLGLE